MKPRCLGTYLSRGTPPQLALIADLQRGQPVSIPRCYFDGVSSEVKTYELCGFCDTSTRAYAAVVYLVMHTDTGRFVQFVVSKTRIAPVQRQTVPRLELLSESCYQLYFLPDS